MSESKPHAHVADLIASVQFASKGIVSKTMYDSPALKLVLFCFEAGQVMSEHTAPFEAVIHVLQGTASVILGGAEHAAAPGAMYVMPEGLTHAITAKEPFVFLLTLVKEASPVTIR